MRHLFFTLIGILNCVLLFGQSPYAFKYQALVRDTQGNVIANQAVSFRISIIEGSVMGNEVYSELHLDTTSAYGICNLKIGEGLNPTTLFSSISWGDSSHFVRVEMDKEGNSSFELLGVSPLLSVPYALHANTVENDKTEDADADPSNELQILSMSGDTIYLSKGGFIKLPQSFSGNYEDLTNKPSNLSNFTNDAGFLTVESDSSVTNEIQVLSISNDTIYLTNGGYVELPDGFSGSYTDLTNKPTKVSDFTNDAGYLTVESDSSVTNEIQVLSISNDTIYLTNGGYVELPDGFSGSYNDLIDKPTKVSDFTNDAGFLTVEADSSITNEIQVLSISNDTIYLTNGGYVELPDGFSGSYNDLTDKPTKVSDFTNDAGYLTVESDSSVTNEIQVLSISNDTIYLTNGGYVELPDGFSGSYTDLTNKPTKVSDFTNDAGYLTVESDSSVTNEIQVLSISNDTIYLTNGGYVELPDGFSGSYTDLTNKPTNVSDFTNDAGYLTAISNGSVTATELADDAVTSAKIKDSTIVTADIVNDAITNAKLANDAVGTSEISNGSVTDAKLALTTGVTFEGATADANETIFAITDPTSDNTITFKDGSGTVAFTSDITTDATKADVELDNLSSVAINTDLTPGTDNAVDLGSSSKEYKDLYIDGAAYLDTADIDAGNIDNTIIGASTPAAATVTTLTANTSVTTATISASGNATLNANVTLGDAATDEVTISGTVQGASPFVFEGSTDDASETTFAITDPTSDNTITFKDGSGTVAFTSDITTDATKADVELDNLSSVAINTDLTPGTDNTVDLGSSSKEYKDLYIDGAAYLDTADIDAGNIDNTVIGASTPAAATVTTLIANTSVSTATISVSGNATLNANVTLGDATTDAVTVSGTVQGASPFVFEGSTDDASETTFAITNPTSDNTITFKDGSGTVAFTSDITTDATKADVELDNLSSVAINTDLTPGTDNTIDLGSSSKEYKDLYIDGAAYLDTADIDAGNIDNTVIGASTPVAATVTTLTANTSVSTATISASGNATLNANVTLGDAATDAVTVSGTVQGASPFVFEGSTDDASETTFAITDPTSDNTITFKDGSGTVAFTSDITTDATKADVELDNLSSVAINTDLTPGTDNAVDLGSSSKEYKDLYIDGAAYLDTADIDAGNIDNTVIGASTPVAATVTTLTANTSVSTATISASGNATLNANVTLGDATTDAVTVSGTVQGASPFVFEGSTDDASETTFAITNPTSDNTITFKDGSGTVAFTSDITTDATKADVELDNLSSVAINTDLTPGTDNTIDLGSSSKEYKDLYIDGAAYLDTADIDAGNIDNTIIGASTPAAATVTTLTANTSVTTATISASGNATLNANVTLGDAATDAVTVSGTVQGASPFVFEGSTDDASETTFAITDPTSDNTITFKDGSGTVAFTSDITTDATKADVELDNLSSVAINTDLTPGTDNAVDLGSASKEFKDAYVDGTAYIDDADIGTLDVSSISTFDGDMTLGNSSTDAITITGTLAGGSPLSFEGASSDASETTFAITDPTSDNTITFQDGSGTVAFTSDISSISDIDNALTINESGAAVDVRMEGDTEANLFFLDGSADNIGIGTSSPTARLHVVGDETINSIATSSRLIIGGQTGGGDAMLHLQESDNGWNLRHKASDNSLRFSNVLAGTDHIVVDQDGYFGIGNTSPNSPLDVTGNTELDGAVTINESSASVDFRVESNSNTHMLFLDGSADAIGINNSSPDNTVQIGSEYVSGAGYGLQVNDADYGVAVSFSQASAGIGLIIDNFQDGDGGVSMLAIRDDNASNMLFEVEGSGEVGIGTSSPSSTLHIDGTMELHNGSTEHARMKFYEDSDFGSNYAQISARSMSADRTITLPDATGTVVLQEENLADIASASSARTNLGLAIGSDVQAYDADLADLADGELTATKVENGSYMISSAGTSGQVWTSDGDGVGGWSSVSLTSITDADADTKIQVEESADEDAIRFDIGGSEMMKLSSSGLELDNGSTSAGTLKIYEDSDDGSNKVTIQAQAMAGDVTLTLPTSTGTIALASNIPSIASWSTWTPTISGTESNVTARYKTIDGELIHINLEFDLTTSAQSTVTVTLPQSAANDVGSSQVAVTGGSYLGVAATIPSSSSTLTITNLGGSNFDNAAHTFTVNLFYEY